MAMFSDYLQAENTDLRADIEMLKKNWESIAAKISQVSAPVSVPATAIAPIASTSVSASTSSQHALSPDEDDLYGAPMSLPALSPPSSSASTNGDGEVDDSLSSYAQPSTSSSTSTRRSARQQQQQQKQAKPNLRKDLSSATGAGFWDASSPFSSAFRGFGAQGGLDVHTTLVPDVRLAAGGLGLGMDPGMSPVSALSEKRVNGLDHFGTANFAANANARQHQQQQLPTLNMNMNPALDTLSSEQVNSLRDQFSSSSASALSGRDRARQLAGKEDESHLTRAGASSSGATASSSFFEQNPFLLLRGESFQDYRGQLYAKLANNAAGIAASSSALKSGAAAPPAGLQPAFFSGAPEQIREAQVGAVAAIAQKTLLEKLSTAFWDAFAGQSPSQSQKAGGLLAAPSSSEKKEVDGQKIADVLSGRSRLQVVKNDQEQEATGLEDALERLALRK